MDAKHEEELDWQRKYALAYAGREYRLSDYWREYRALDEINDAVPAPREVLDVGCGISTGLVLWPDANLRYGIDSLADEYKRFYTYPIGLCIAQVEADGPDVWPFDNGWFDLAICTNALDHMTDPLLALRRIHDVLREKTGIFFLSVEIFDTQGKRNASHPWSMTEENIITITSKAKLGEIWHEVREHVRGPVQYFDDVLPGENHDTWNGIYRRID